MIYILFPFQPPSDILRIASVCTLYLSLNVQSFSKLCQNLWMTKEMRLLLSLQHKLLPKNKGLKKWLGCLRVTSAYLKKKPSNRKVLYNFL